MAKASKPQLSSSQQSGNRKLTDFFARKSSAALPSSPVAHSSNSNASKFCSKSSAAMPLPSSPLREPKKENVPPRLNQEIISISSRSDAATHISISSDDSVISISSTSFSPLPVPIAIVDVSPGPSRTRPKDSRFLNAVDITSSPPRRKSPRLNEKPEKHVKRESFNDMRTISPTKIKKPTGPGTTSGSNADQKKGKKRKNTFEDDDESYLGIADDVIFTGRITPTNVDRGIAESLNAGKRYFQTIPRNVPPCKVSPKKAKVSQKLKKGSDLEEIIPSSQSDEKELSLPKRARKDAKKIKETVEAWQKSSQSFATPDGPGLDYETCSQAGVDFGVDIESHMDVDTEMPSFEQQSSPVRLQKSFGPQTPGDHSLDHSVANEQAHPEAQIIADVGMVSSDSCVPICDVAQSIIISDSPRFTFTLPSTPSRPQSSSPKSGLKRILRPHSPHVFSSASSLTKITRTPSPTHKLLPPVSPAVLDEKSKTAAIIEQIKAQAFAASSPEPDARVLRELKALSDTSSDCEEEDLFANFRKKPAARFTDKGKARSTYVSDGESSPLTDIEDLSPRRMRPRVRAISHVSASSTAASVLKTRSGRSSGSITLGNLPTTIMHSTPKSQNKKKAKKGGDPFAALLKEKARAVKHGTMPLSLPLMDEETEAALAFGSQLGLKSSPTPHQSSDDGDLENVMGDKDRARLLGTEEGRAVGKILESDKNGYEVTEKVIGLPLWDDSLQSQCMEVDESCGGGLPPLEISDNNVILKALKASVDHQDVAQIIQLFQLGALTVAEDLWTGKLTAWIFDLAISTNKPSLAQHAFRALLQRNSRVSAGVKLQFSSVHSALYKLGAKANILQVLEQQVYSQARLNVDAYQRAQAVYHIVALIDSFAGAHQLESDDVPNFVTALLCIALNPNTESSVKRDVIRAVENLCTSYCTENTSRDPMEIKICLQILQLAPCLTPSSKAYLLYFLPGGTGLVRRVAQWVAYGLLNDSAAAITEIKSSASAPPLSSIISLFSPSSRNSPEANGPGIFEIRRSRNQVDETDYEALGLHVEILSTVLTNISVYVQMEKEEQQVEERCGEVGTSAAQSPSRKTQKAKMEVLGDMLNILGGKIVDTRAAHLDRSRTKAAIQHVTMRVYYQRQTALNAGFGSGKSRHKKLDAWFQPRRSLSQT